MSSNLNYETLYNDIFEKGVELGSSNFYSSSSVFESIIHELAGEFEDSDLEQLSRELDFDVLDRDIVNSIEDAEFYMKNPMAYYGVSQRDFM